MASEQAIALLKEAKQLYDYGAFTPLRQAEFFKAMEEELDESLSAPPPPASTPELVPLVAGLPEIGASLQVSETSDRKA